MRRNGKLALKGLGILGLVAAALLLERRVDLGAVLDAARIEDLLKSAGPWAPLIFIGVTIWAYRRAKHAIAQPPPDRATGNGHRLEQLGAVLAQRLKRPRGAGR